MKKNKIPKVFWSTNNSVSTKLQGSRYTTLEQMSWMHQNWPKGYFQVNGFEDCNMSTYLIAIQQYVTACLKAVVGIKMMPHLYKELIKEQGGTSIATYYGMPVFSENLREVVGVSNIAMIIIVTDGAVDNSNLWLFAVTQ